MKAHAFIYMHIIIKTYECIYVRVFVYVLSVCMYWLNDLKLHLIINSATIILLLVHPYYLVNLENV